MFKKIFANLIHFGSKKFDKKLKSHKIELFKNVSGTVIEIGAGTGINVSYFPKTINYTAVEPNIYMHKFLFEELKKHQIKNFSVLKESAEKISLPDNFADFFVSTFTLCSVKNKKMIFDEIKRILKSGGKFLFIEHTGADLKTFLGLTQKILKPIWKIIGGGCDLRNKTIEDIKSSKLKIINIAQIPKIKGIESPCIIGVAIKM